MTDEIRRSTWGIGLVGYQHSLKSGDGHNLIGPATAVQLGYAYIADNWLMNTSIDILSGPFNSPQKQGSQIDFNGTGGSFFYAISAEDANIRTYEGNYGFGLGVSYADIIGRRVSSEYVESIETENLVMRVTYFAIQPAVFFTWLDSKPRLISNRPDDLKTRIEGYTLNIGFHVPLITTYKLKWKEQETAEDGTISINSRRDKGELFGFSIIVSFWAFLGV